MVLLDLQIKKKTIELSDKEYNKFQNSNLKELSIRALFNRYKKLLRLLQKPYSHFYACQPQYFQDIEKYIIEKLNKNFKEKISNEIYSTLTLSEEFDSLTIEELEWLKIIEKAQKNKDIKKDVQKHSNKYLFLGTVETENPWNLNHYMKLLEKQIKTNVSNKIKEIKLKKEKLNQKKDFLIKKYNIQSDIPKICNSLAKIGINRLALRFAWTKVIYMYLEVLNEIKKKTTNASLTKDMISESRIEELEDILFNNKIISKEEIKKRKKAYLFYSKDFPNYLNKKDIEFYSGDDAIKMKNKLIQEQNINLKEFNGTIACKGKVKGRVKLFTWLEENLTKEMDEMKKGDILVAGQTRPFLMPAIRKAGAIIADEGGITGHASIISRELKIPCIIGTKIATKVLKDGMLVEVDADKGIVKILEKTKEASK